MQCQHSCQAVSHISQIFCFYINKYVYVHIGQGEFQTTHQPNENISMNRSFNIMFSFYFTFGYFKEWCFSQLVISRVTISLATIPAYGGRLWWHQSVCCSCFFSCQLAHLPNGLLSSMTSRAAHDSPKLRLGLRVGHTPRSAMATWRSENRVQLSACGPDRFQFVTRSGVAISLLPSLWCVLCGQIGRCI